MNKQLLVDHIPFHIAKLQPITEGKDSKLGDGLMRVKGKLQEADVKNGNGRVYPLKTLKEQIDKYMNGPMASRTSTGELDHPESSIINLSNVSHLITKIWWEGNNVMGELTLLNTPSGKIAQEIIKANIPLGISSRGMGSVKQMGETLEVQNDFELLCWDFVSTPSNPGSWMNPLHEGLIKNTNNYSKANEIIREILCAHGNCPIF
jgi:hypothetical protein